jgi:CelD/BcsL family acetyltransferase involved in cellulose biosynthesis
VISLSILTTLSELERVRGEWIDLWERCSHRTPFQRPEWIIAWCRHFDCRSIWTPVVRKEGRLVAVAPWLTYHDETRRLVAFSAGGVSDYHDVLIDPASTDEAIEQLFGCLFECREQWDACDFEQLAPWSALRAARVPPCFRDTLTDGPPCPQVLMPTWPAPLSGIVPPGQLARFAKYRRRAERQGNLVFERSSVDTVADAWSDVFRLHRARWETRGLEGALGEERLCAFHRTVVADLAPVCAGVDRVTLDGTTIAALYGFVIGNVKYCYLQGVDPARSSLSPGLLLVGMVLEDAQKQGITCVDFLRGDEPYKLSWGPAIAVNARRQLSLDD